MLTCFLYQECMIHESQSKLINQSPKQCVLCNGTWFPCFSSRLLISYWDMISNPDSGKHLTTHEFFFCTFGHCWPCLFLLTFAEREADLWPQLFWISGKNGSVVSQKIIIRNVCSLCVLKLLFSNLKMLVEKKKNSEGFLSVKSWYNPWQLQCSYCVGFKTYFVVHPLRSTTFHIKLSFRLWYHLFTLVDLVKILAS